MGWWLEYNRLSDLNMLTIAAVRLADFNNKKKNYGRPGCKLSSTAHRRKFLMAFFTCLMKYKQGLKEKSYQGVRKLILSPFSKVMAVS